MFHFMNRRHNSFSIKEVNGKSPPPPRNVCVNAGVQLFVSFWTSVVFDEEGSLLTDGQSIWPVVQHLDTLTLEWRWTLGPHIWTQRLHRYQSSSAELCIKPHSSVFLNKREPADCQCRNASCLLRKSIIITDGVFYMVSRRWCAKHELILIFLSTAFDGRCLKHTDQR